MYRIILLYKYFICIIIWYIVLIQNFYEKLVSVRASLELYSAKSLQYIFLQTMSIADFLHRNAQRGKAKLI